MTTPRTRRTRRPDGTPAARSDGGPPAPTSPGRAPRPPVRRRRARAALVAALALVAAATVLPSPAAPATAASCPAPGGAVVPEAPSSGTGDVTVHGHGWGHGMGMSQYGARGAALLGCSADRILTTYYPGLRPAVRATRPVVMVDLLTGGGASSRAEVVAEGGAVRWGVGDRSAVQPAGSTWTVRRGPSGAVVVLAGTGSSAAAVTALTPRPGEQVVVVHPGTAVRVSTWTSSSAAPLVRRSDGDRARFAARSTGLEVRQLLVDDGRGSAVAKYLRGLAEMPVSWPAAAQEAQVVAARTFLLGKLSSAEGAYVIRPTTADQVWLGLDRQREDARYGGGLARAVAATSTATGGRVMETAAGALARDLLYASSHGGWSETNTYVWGSAPVGHLRAVDDSRWAAASGDPNAAWAVDLSWAQVARAFGLSSASGLEVAPRGSAARTAVVVTGTRDGAPVVLRVTGQQARDRLAAVAPGVRSSGFTTTRRPAAPAATTSPGAPVSGDFDGDGADEVGWFRDGTWTLRSRDGSTRTVVFGRAGDAPVTGDWDGDGTDGIGVVRSAVWHLRDRATAGAADRTFAYGRPGQRPVTGVWAPGRPTGVGVVVGGTWHLRDAVGPGPSSRTWTFGAATARPVPGDWDGDGVDDPGALEGATWTFGSSARLPIAPLVLGRPGVVGVSGRWGGAGGDLPGVGRGGVVHVASRLDDGRSAAAWRVLP